MAARRPETPTISVFKRNFVDRRDRREYATMRALPFPFLSSCFKWRLLTADVLTTLRDIRPLSSLLHLRSFALTMHPLFSRRKFIIVFFEFFSNSSNFAKGERERVLSISLIFPFDPLWREASSRRKKTSMQRAEECNSSSRTVVIEDEPDRN